MTVSTAARIWNGVIYNSVLGKQKVEDKINAACKFVSAKSGKIKDKVHLKKQKKEDAKSETTDEMKQNTKEANEEKEPIIDVEPEDLKEVKPEENSSVKDDDEVTYTGPDFSSLKEENIMKEMNKEEELHEVTEEKLDEALNKNA